jgi:hypothetical protein
MLKILIVLALCFLAIMPGEMKYSIDVKKNYAYCADLLRGLIGKSVPIVAKGSEITLD